MWRRSRTIPCTRRKQCVYVGNGWKCVNEVPLRPRKAAIKMMDHESRKRCNHHHNHHHHQQGWGWWSGGGLVGGAMAYLPNWGRPVTARCPFLFRRPCRIQPRHHRSLVRRACPPTSTGGVAGITEDGSCYAHPNTFRAERDGRFNWSSYRTVVLHVTEPERSVIVALFLPPYYY
jgi:hypothetical protein